MHLRGDDRETNFNHSIADQRQWTEGQSSSNPVAKEHRIAISVDNSS